MSEFFPLHRPFRNALLGAVLLGACSAPPTDPSKEKRIPLGTEKEQVIVYSYPNGQSRDITTHTEEHSGWLNSKTYDSDFHQYCDTPEGSAPGAPASVLVSTYMKSQLAKFGGNHTMLLAAPGAPECADGVLNEADQNIPNYSPIPPTGEPKDMGPVSLWEPPK